MCVFSSCVSVGLLTSLLSGGGGGLTTQRVACGRFMSDVIDLSRPGADRTRPSSSGLQQGCQRTHLVCTGVTVPLTTCFVLLNHFLTQLQYCSSCVLFFSEVYKQLRVALFWLERSALRLCVCLYISRLRPHDLTDCHAIRNHRTWYYDESTNMQGFLHIPLISKWRPLSGSFVQVVASSELISFDTTVNSNRIVKHFQIKSTGCVKCTAPHPQPTWNFVIFLQTLQSKQPN